MPLSELLTVYPLAFIILALVLGLVIGSFLNVLVWRLPKMLERDWRQQALEVLGLPGDAAGPTYNLMLPQSHCPHCAHPLRARDNIPLLSYLCLRGRCAHCRAPISARYPLVELACCLVSGFVAWHFGFGWQAGAMLLLSWGLLALCLIDADHQLLPDVLALPPVADGWSALQLGKEWLLRQGPCQGNKTSLLEAIWPLSRSAKAFAPSAIGTLSTQKLV